MMRKNLPQRYGAQFSKSREAGGKWELYKVDDTIVSDEERKQLKVPTLEKERARAHRLNGETEGASPSQTPSDSLSSRQEARSSRLQNRRVFLTRLRDRSKQLERDREPFQNPALSRQTMKPIVFLCQSPVDQRRLNRDQAAFELFEIDTEAVFKGAYSYRPRLR
jgi:hypothetical protein